MSELVLNYPKVGVPAAQDAYLQDVWLPYRRL